MYDGRMNWLRRTGILSLLAALVVLIAATGALAATPSEVADQVSLTGFYLDGNVSISAGDASAIVSTARNGGSRFYLVVLDSDPAGGNTVFAENVLDALGLDSGTVLVLSPENVGWITIDDGFVDSDLSAAGEYANEQGGDDARYADNFVFSLFGEHALTGTASSSSGTSSGGGSGLIWFLAIVVVVGLLLFWLVRHSKKQTVNAAAEQMAKAREAIQKQVDAIANDILDMEDEVRVSDNSEAEQYYNQASETYRNVGDRLQKAGTPQELLSISNELDAAIWQLDCAEAILDGKPKPPEPEPKTLEPPVSTTEERVTIPAPRPDYQRRPGRRSSYAGSGMMDILMGVAGQVLAGGAMSRRSGGGLGGLGGLLGGMSGTRRTPRSRSGGMAPRSTGRSVRRGGGNRIRGGMRRRR
jgi:hypothetical protein